MSTLKDKRLSRRDMLKLIGVTAAAGALAGCAPQVAPTATQAPEASATSAPAATKAPEATATSAPPATKAPEATATSAPAATNTAAAAPAGLPAARADILLQRAGAGQMVRSDGFNPYAPGGEDWGNGYRYCVMEHLWYPNLITGELKPWLAMGAEYNSDYTMWTVHLRDKVTWNDGVAFTADDVVFTIDMVRNNEKLDNYTAFHEAVDSVTAKDSLTVEVKLKKPTPRFHYLFQPTFGFDSKPIIPKHIWEKVDPLTFINSNPVGTGPMVVVPTKPSDNMWVYKRRDGYWAETQGLLPRLEMEYYIYQYGQPQDAEYQFMLQNGSDYDALDFTVFKKLMGQNPKWKYETVMDPCPRSFLVNCDLYPLSKPEVRLAIAHCFDRNLVATTLMQPPGQLGDPWAPFGPLQKFVDPDIVKKYDPDFNPDKAKQILDGLGFKPGSDGIRVDDKGKRMSFECAVWDKPGGLFYEYPAALAKTLKDVGIELNLKMFGDWPSYVDASQKGQFGLTTGALCGMRDPTEIFDNLTSKYYKPIGTATEIQDPSRWQNAEFDQVMAQIDAINPDAPEAKALYAKALELFYANLPKFPGVVANSATMYNETYWTNWPTKDNPYTLFSINWDLGKWILHNLKKAKA